MKKIITVSMIKNEADIIETFVRYTMNFATKMFIIDNGSTDGSIEILKALIKEGFDIEIYSEAQVFYEQFLIENKYIKKISKEYKFDFLIPLDIDEFLASDNNMLEQINSLPEDKLIVLKWRTYCILSEKAENLNKFFLDRIVNIRINEKITFTKIIIPYKLFNNNNILVRMGHHNIECNSEIQKVYLDDIYIAHFPVRSIDQIQLKTYQGIITQLMSSYHSVVVFQWKKILEELKNGVFNLVKYSVEYALPFDQDMKNIDFIEKPFDYSWCKKSIIPCYEKLQNKSVLFNIYELMQVIVIKNIINENSKKKKIIIFGTGGTAEKFLQYISEDKYSILAYVDSDIKKEYSLFYNKLVIAPDKIKYIKYDYIIIVSKFFDEIYDLLLESGVKREKILSRFDIIEQQILITE